MGNDDDDDDNLIHDLLYATLSRDANKVEELMQCGIDPCSPTKDGTSPIHKAALLESPAGPNIISRMLSYGADPNITTPTGLSPLHIAAMWGRVDTLDVLLDGGADPSLKDVDDMSALDYTDEADENKEECIDALTRYRPPVKRRYSDSPRGYTGDVSENNRSDSVCESTFSDCFWSHASSPKELSRNTYSTPNQSPVNSPRMKSKNSKNRLSLKSCDRCNGSGTFTPSMPNRHSRKYSSVPNQASRNVRGSPKHCSGNFSNICCSPNQNVCSESKVVKGKHDDPGCNRLCSTPPCTQCPDISPKKNNSSLFVPLSAEEKKNCDIVLKISVLNSLPSDFSRKSDDSAFENDYDIASAYNSMEQMHDNPSNELLNDSRLTNCATYINFDAQSTLDVDEEATVDYLSKSLDEVDNSPKHVDKMGMNENGTDELHLNLTNSSLPKQLINRSKMNGLDLTDVNRNKLSPKDSINRSKMNGVDLVDVNGNKLSPKQLANHSKINGVDSIGVNYEKLSPSKRGINHSKMNGVDSSDINRNDLYPSKRGVNHSKINGVESVDVNYNKSSPSKQGVIRNTSPNILNEKNVTPSKFNFTRTNELDCSLTDLNLSQQQTKMIEELAEVNVEYDWKDISDIGTASEFEESILVVPGNILALSDSELRSRLKKAGETPGPISDTTRKLYQKHLTRVEKNNNRPLKPSDKYKDYTPEMRVILNESSPLSKERGELLETEMTLKFIHPEKHTWREGSMKTSFNYLLLDPRVTNNLAERAKYMSYVEQLRVFMASVFYIGKGKNSRPYEHLFEVIKIEKKDRSPRPPSNKQRMIHDIWASGLGVVSLHVFHGVIPVEAYTREACMIEALGLARLTNAKSGDFYGDAASWHGKKRRELGIFILSKAMEIYILEGERQIRQIDLVK